MFLRFLRMVSILFFAFNRQLSAIVSALQLPKLGLRVVVVIINDNVAGVLVVVVVVVVDVEYDVFECVKIAVDSSIIASNEVEKAVLGKDTVVTIADDVIVADVVDVFEAAVDVVETDEVVEATVVGMEKVAIVSSTS